MRHVLYIIVFLLISSCTRTGQLHVITFNTGTSFESDSINNWENRLPIIQQFFKEQDPDIVGMQNVNIKRLNSLSTILSDYIYVLSQEIDKAEDERHNPIFFKANKFEVLSKSQFVLPYNNITNKESMVCNNVHVINWVKMQSIESGHIFFVFNVFYSKNINEKDTESTSLLLKKIRELSGNAPVIVTGSFNMDKQSRSYRILRSNWDHFLSIENSSELTKCSNSKELPNFNAYGQEEFSAMSDYIFVNSYFDVKRNETHPVKENNVFISDYYPVSAHLKFLFNRRTRQGDITERPWRNQ